MTNSNDSLAQAGAEVVAAAVTGKKFWMSKTFWVNIVAAGAMLAQMQFGFMFSPELQAVALTLINLVLRSVTKEPVTW